MGAFPEGSEIRVSRLIKLWIAEGFLKLGGEDLEVVGEEYLMDLISRNLVLVDKWRSTGKLKSCKMHHLLRDFCLREALREKFLYVPSLQTGSNSDGIERQRRLSVQQNTLYEEYRPLANVLQPASLARSLICDIDGILPLETFRLLRVLKVADRNRHQHQKGKQRYSLDDTFQLLNLRYISVPARWGSDSKFPSSVNTIWNLQTLIVGDNRWRSVAPSEIWEMHQLRHLEFDKLHLPDPPSIKIDGRDKFVLKNLQTLLGIRNLRFSEEVVKRIPNIRKLEISYDNASKGFGEYCLRNLGRLQKLESLACFFLLNEQVNRTDLLQNIVFPPLLKKLTLQGCDLLWEDMRYIGSLSHLEVLKLKLRSFRGTEWCPVEGEFSCLKFLLIDHCHVKYWIADNTHFPCLEHLVLRSLNKLEKVPSEIGETPTLLSIQLENCSNSAAISAKRIEEEQVEMGNEELQVEVTFAPPLKKKKKKKKKNKVGSRRPY